MTSWRKKKQANKPNTTVTTSFISPPLLSQCIWDLEKSKSVIFTVLSVVFLSSVFSKCQNHLVKMGELKRLWYQPPSFIRRLKETAEDRCPEHRLQVRRHFALTDILTLSLKSEMSLLGELFYKETIEETHISKESIFNEWCLVMTLPNLKLGKCRSNWRGHVNPNGPDVTFVLPFNKIIDFIY